MANMVVQAQKEEILADPEDAKDRKNVCLTAKKILKNANNSLHQAEKKEMGNATDKDQKAKANMGGHFQRLENFGNKVNFADNLANLILQKDSVRQREPGKSFKNNLNSKAPNNFNSNISKNFKNKMRSNTASNTNSNPENFARRKNRLPNHHQTEAPTHLHQLMNFTKNLNLHLHQHQSQ